MLVVMDIHILRPCDLTMPGRTAYGVLAYLIPMSWVPDDEIYLKHNDQGMSIAQ